MFRARKSNQGQARPTPGITASRALDRDEQVYFITARCRDKSPALASEQAKAVFSDRFTYYAAQSHFTPFVVSVLNNHYHLLGYLERAMISRGLMKGVHGSVAKLPVNDLLPTRLVPSWLDRRLKNYFDGCLREEKQFDRTYRYVLRQSVRHGICTNWRDCPPHACVHAVRRSATLLTGSQRLPARRARKSATKNTRRLKSPAPVRRWRIHSPVPPRDSPCSQPRQPLLLVRLDQRVCQPRPASPPSPHPG